MAVDTKNDSTETMIFDVSGMNCASCAGKVENALRGVEGVREAAVNFAAETANVALEGPNSADETTLIQAVEGAGFKAVPHRIGEYEEKAAARDSRGII